ncbi:MAG: hypothetical protein Q9191_007329 [Dirinaria sp. TL-2023a]
MGTTRREARALEILRMILTLVMMSIEPVHLSKFVQLSHEIPHERKLTSQSKQEWNSDLENNTETPEQSRKDRFKTLQAEFRERFATDPIHGIHPSLRVLSSSSRNFSLTELVDKEHEYKGQVQHYWDWCLVNGTCRVFRAVGKPLFFLTKVFVIAPSLRDGFETGRVKNMTACDIALARESIREIFVPLGSCGAAAPYIKLPRYNYFTGLRKLSIQPHNPINCCLSEKWTKALPEAFADLLRAMDVPVDEWNMQLVCDSNEDAAVNMQ